MLSRRVLLAAVALAHERTKGLVNSTSAGPLKWFQTRPTSKGFLTHLGMFKPPRLFAFQTMMHFALMTMIFYKRTKVP